MVKKIGTDLHSLIGASGFFATLSLQSVNESIAALVGVATLFYMTFRALREWGKWKKDNQNEKEKNEV